METKPRYTLFPTANFPSPPQSRGHTHPPSPPPQPEALIPIPGTSHSRDEPLLQPDESYTPQEEMHAPRPSDSSSSDLSFHKPTVDLSSTPPPASIPRIRPKTVYIHNGIGGRGNYHKMIKEKDNAPNQTLQPAPSSRRQNNGRFLSSLFGSKKGQRRGYEGGAVSGGSGSGGSGQTLSLGAAEVMRRKMLGQRAEGKRSSSSQRS